MISTKECELMVSDFLQKMHNDHGVAIRSIDVKWIEYTTFESKKREYKVTGASLFLLSKDIDSQM